jgi:Zn-dependent protease with chaperone function
VQHRHSLRHLLQDSITALAAMAVYGDATAITGLAATAPTALMHTGYSRDFEREADTFAFDLLKKTGRSPLAFANAMTALEAAHDKHRDRGEGTCKDDPKKAGDADGKTDPEDRQNERECDKDCNKGSDRDSDKLAKPAEPKAADGVEPKVRRRGLSGDYLSTHPAISERIEAAKEAARR